jgi:hypothetical protein
MVVAGVLLAAGFVVQLLAIHTATK